MALSTRSVWEASSRRLRAAGLTIVQASVAAMVAWSVARFVLGQPQPVFAPLVAMSAIGVSLERRLRPSIEMVLGVAVGILVGDLFIAWAGPGTWQIGLVVALAMIASVIVRGGPILVLQASSTAVVIATILPPEGDEPFAVGRFIEALIGGTVGLAITVLLPANPLREVIRVASPLLGGLSGTLTKLSGALRERDADLAGAALAEAHGLQVSVEQAATTLEAGKELALLAPARWGARETLDTLVDAIPYVDAAVRDTRVLARQALAAIQGGDAIPPGLDVATDEAAIALRALQQSVDSGGDLAAARAAALRAATAGTEAVEHTSGLLAQTVAGQIRSVAADVLYATGLTQQDVGDLLPGLPVPVSRRSRQRVEQVSRGGDTGEHVVGPEPQG